MAIATATAMAMTKAMATGAMRATMPKAVATLATMEATVATSQATLTLTTSMATTVRRRERGGDVSRGEFARNALTCTSLPR